MLQFWLKENDWITLPSGRVLNLRRSRSEGPLDREELEACRAHGVPLAYDPAQIGWVPAMVEDDISGHPAGSTLRAGVPGSWPAGQLRLRPWRREEVSVFLDLLDNPKVWTYLPEGYPDPLTEETAQALIELAIEGAHHDVLAVERDGEVMGQVRLAFDPLMTDMTRGEISYWLGERFWGHGVGSDLVAQFTARSFARRPDLAAIWARVHEDNAPSARVLEKCGYREVGRSPGDRRWRIFEITRAEAD